MKGEAARAIPSGISFVPFSTQPSPVTPLHDARTVHRISPFAHSPPTSRRQSSQPSFDYETFVSALEQQMRVSAGASAGVSAGAEATTDAKERLARAAAKRAEASAAASAAQRGQGRRHASRKVERKDRGIVGLWDRGVVGSWGCGIMGL